MPSPNSDFVKWLQRYDSRLKASWSLKYSCFIVEHTDILGKVYIVLKTDYLDVRAKEAIFLQDMRRWGGGLKMLNSLEKQEEGIKIKIHEHEMQNHVDMASAAYDHMQVKQGERVFQ